jgi:ABC-2 type transport system ATP-binding protein
MTLGDAAEPRVHIKDFRMEFGETTVIKDLPLDVRAGETFGFLGSNGSGKTATLRALLGSYQPTAGPSTSATSPSSRRTGRTLKWQTAGYEHH